MVHSWKEKRSSFSGSWQFKRYMAHSSLFIAGRKRVAVAVHSSWLNLSRKLKPARRQGLKLKGVHG